MSDYLAPYGSADPNASYVDRNTPGAVAGSKVPGLAIEMPQREIRTVIVAAGLTPLKTNPTQLNAAIDAKIAAALGSGENPLADLLTLLRSKMLVYPETLTSDGKLPVLSPSIGLVRVPLGYSFRHRGVFDVTTVQTDFATVANKTYHLRWNPTEGFALKDLANGTYNPGGALAETDPAFDSGYDDILFSRVVTDASNVATITNLRNRNRLIRQASASGAGSAAVDNVSYSTTFTLDEARTPQISVTGSMNYTGAAPGTYGQIFLNQISVSIRNRYQVAASITVDLDRAGSSVTGALNILAVS